MLTMILFIFRTFESTKWYGNNLPWLFRLILPPFNFASALLSLSSRTQLTYIYKEKELLSLWDYRICGGDYWMMIVQIFFMFFLLISLERLKNVKWFTNLLVKKDLIKAKPYKFQDNDVLAEEKRVMAQLPNDSKIRLQRIRKVYPLSANMFKVAVKNVSFAIDQGECFSLLGINGAGKSTIFKMLTGDINPTDGQATIGGFIIP